MSDFNQPFLHLFERQTQSETRRFETAGASRLPRSAWSRFWLRLSTRHALREMDAATLRDVGLTRQQALEEAYRPFWRLFRM
ncbi:DUF1127 domain-containing protein [Pseudomonas matsuisoli]|uniref:YjiS-like domain-containing protein n=1 Tax=Pseudomonas matsuisoli TaxID=1515666 RepID=A0A917PX47_9PSED|nr:DUF1127 domain-containing protein [Pseudomonas matsuisoli]GGJ96756.1 hypothetical protein GCM10009304_23320 [Pseudomonas matsuisoli]